MSLCNKVVAAPLTAPNTRLAQYEPARTKGLPRPTTPAAFCTTGMMSFSTASLPPAQWGGCNEQTASRGLVELRRLAQAGRHGQAGREAGMGAPFAHQDWCFVVVFSSPACLSRRAAASARSASSRACAASPSLTSCSRTCSLRSRMPLRRTCAE